MPASTAPRIQIRSTSPSSSSAVLALAGTLTQRDLDVIAYLARHDVLTALHLARLLFGSYSHARSRLATLHARGVVARFRRDIWPGSQPWRYTLGPAGALIHAAATGASLPRPAAVTDTVARIAYSTHTEHRLGVNGFFATLAGHARHHPGSALRQWRPERETAHACGGIVRPDAYGVYISPDGRTLGFFLEHDTGTETLATLLDKITKYAELADAGLRRTVLFHLPTTTREQHLHAALTHRWPTGPPVPLATVAADALAPSGPAIVPASPSIAEQVWLRPGATGRRALTALDSPG